MTGEVGGARVARVPAALSGGTGPRWLKRCRTGRDHNVPRLNGAETAHSAVTTLNPLSIRDRIHFIPTPAAGRRSRLLA